jgi:hypothetical protein
MKNNNMQEWVLIAGLFARLAYGLDEIKQQAALRMLDKLLHKTGVLNSDTKLNGECLSRQSSQQEESHIVQLSCDCLDDIKKCDWYDGLTIANGKMLNNLLLKKFGVEVLFLPALPS